MDTLLNLPMKLASGLLAVALILMSLRGPPGGGTSPQQLEFPFMVERSLEDFAQLSRKERRKEAYRRAGLSV